MEGIFRLSGSAKRIKDLQNIFNSPDRYGKGLDWTGYTVHDAANILRRYLNQLPEPIVPLDFYERFRDPLRPYETRATNDGEAQPPDLTVDEHADAVAAYQKLITELPPLNRQLLLYILDLLAVFASKSDLNRMTAANLAAIFQPGIISHPSHDMTPSEYRLSQDVLIFLIENQDHFLIGMSGTAVDEKTQKDVESGPPSIKTPKSNIGRSASNASAGGDSLRKYGVRRNVSVSSHGSRDRSSPGVSSPGTPTGVAPFSSGSGGVAIARSNTVPSKRSPAIAANRFQRRPADLSGSNSPVVSSPMASSSMASSPVAVAQSPVTNHDGGAHPQLSSSPSLVPRRHNKTEAALETNSAAVPIQSASTQGPPVEPHNSPSPTTTPGFVPATRERKISNLFSKSPIFGPSDVQHRQTKRLQKRQRLPGSANESAQSSQNSLPTDESGAFYTPLVSPDLASLARPDPIATSGPTVTNTAPTPVHEISSHRQFSPPPTSNDRPNQSAGLKPPTSPEPSIHSRSSVTDHSEFEPLDDSGIKSERADKRRHRWRFSASAKKSDGPLVPPPPIGQNPGARGSNSSIGSSTRPRKSFTGDSQLTQQMGTEASSTGQPSLLGQLGHESSELLRDATAETEKRGLFGKWKAKMSQTREERRERDVEKERAKSPPRASVEQGASRSSLAAFAQEHLTTPRGRSFDKPREEALSTAAQRPDGDGQNQPRRASAEAQ